MKNTNEKSNYKSKINKRMFETSFLSLIFLLFSVMLCLTMFSGCTSESEPQCNHEWSDWEETSAATCTKPGMQQRTCNICGQTESEGIARLSSTGQHTPTEWTVTKVATCTEPGEQESTCSVCGETITEEIPALNPTGHTLANTTVTKAATCTEPGEQQGVCSVCNQTVTEEIPALGHNFVDDEIITFASIGVNGTKRQKCTNCGQTLDISFELTPQEEANISLVMNGTLNNYPNETINTVFSTYFANTQWAANGNLVIFGGDCTWLGEPAKAVIAFEVTDSSFVISQIEIDDNVFTNLLDISSIIDAVYSG